jgi:hypothetical protein
MDVNPYEPPRIASDKSPARPITPIPASLLALAITIGSSAALVAAYLYSPRDLNGALVVSVGAVAGACSATVIRRLLIGRQ